MTEDQAVERIKRALIYTVGPGGSDELDNHSLDTASKAAWNEMKVIAREDSSPPEIKLDPGYAAYLDEVHKDIGQWRS